MHNRSMPGSEDHRQALIPGLPWPIAHNCLARVPRGLYAWLRLVSSNWNKALKPEVIYPIRSAEGISEAWLYILLMGNQAFYALDPALMNWKPLPSIPSTDHCFTMGDKECFVAGRQLLVFGPSFQVTQIKPVIWRYNLDTNKWTIAPPMKSPRCLFASASHGSVAFVAGGAQFDCRRPLRTAEMFCSDNNSWQILPDMIMARKECSGFILHGCFYVIGGSNERDQPYDSGEFYNPQTRKWTLVPNLWPHSSRMEGGTLAPPLVAVVKNELYAWDHPRGKLKMYNRSTGSWIELGGAPGRLPNPQSHGWGIGFKAVGDELWLIGGSNPEMPFIDACTPDPKSGRLVWRRVCTTWNGQGFVFNCAVMKA